VLRGAVIAVALLAAAAGALPAGARQGDAFPNVDVFSVTLTSKERNLTANAALDTQPATAPNGRTVAFVSSRGGSPDLYLMDASGGHVRRLTTSPFTVAGVDAQMVAWGDFDVGGTTIAWAPDSRRLAFSALNATIDPSCFHDCYGSSVFVANADGSGLRLVDTSARNPVWSPNGRLLAYEGDVDPFGEAGAYYVVRAGGGGKVRIPAYDGDSAPPAWSPDSRQLAFQTFRHLRIPAEIDVVAATGKHRRKLTIGYEPAWSAFGPIAFVRGQRLHAIAANGTGDRILTRPGESAFSPSWSPTAKRVAFTVRTAKTKRCQVATVELPSGIERQVTHEPPRATLDGGPVWAPSGTSLVFARWQPPSGGCG
jgi:Tol biopolymer transport system component